MTDQPVGTEKSAACLNPPLRNCTYREFRDPADLHRAYRKLNLHTQDFVDLAPGHTFHHWVGGLMVNHIPLIAGIVTRTRVFLGESSDLLLIVMADGVLDLSSKVGTVHSQAGGIVLAPVAEGELEIGGKRCALKLRPAAIARAAAAMAGLESGLTRWGRKRFEHFSPVAHQASQAQARNIHELLRFIDACFAVGPHVAMRLGLDDQIHHVAASLLLPELLTEEPADLLRQQERSGKDAFDALIDFIRANLDQPLRLSDLETRSHYSRRSLQYAFQERLGCSPKQWIREQRLALALEQLQAEGQHPPIRNVALACGYVNPGHFASDFKRRYGMTPLQASRS